jgi:hypothetical protein
MLAITTLLTLLFVGSAQAGPLEDVSRALKARDYRVVHFGFDLDRLDAQAKRKLNRQAGFIRRNTEIVFAVVGHTDKVGNRAYNEALGMRRAMRVVDYLVQRGVRREQLRAMTSRGEDQPVIATLDRERLNRRVETVVYRFVDNGSARISAPTVNASATGTPTSSPIAPATTTTSTTGGTTTPTSSPSPALAPTSAPAPAPAPSPEPTSEPAPEPSLPGNKAAGIGRPDAGKGNGDEPSGDPEGSIGHNKGGDEPVNGGN